MRKTILILTILLTQILIYAQPLEVITFNDFKPLNLKVNTLDLRASANFDQTLQNRNVKSTSGSSFSNINFSAFRNTQKLQSNFLVNTVYNSIKNAPDQFNSLVLIDRRNYIKPNLYFETNAQLYNTNLIIKNNEDFSLFNIIPELRMGVGRIDPIGSALLGAFIIDDLKKGNIDIGIYDKQMLYELGNKIAEVGLRSVFDGRRALLTRYKEITSLLTKDKNLSEEEIIEAAGIVYDNLAFAYNPFRSAGYRFSIGTKSDYAIHRESSLDMTYSLKAEYSKAIKRFFQVSTKVETGLINHISNKDKKHTSFIEALGSIG